jgi:general secretion pathway protein H
MASKVIIRNLSATGNKAVALAAAGFTLMEMMVVLTIMGIALIVCLPMLNNSREAYVLQRESARLLEALHLAAAEAMLEGDEWGAQMTSGSYRFVRFDRDAGQWAAISEPLLSEHALPSFLNLSLQVNNALRLLADTSPLADFRPDIVLLSTGQTSDFFLRLKVNSDGRLATVLTADGRSSITARKDDSGHKP